MDRKQMIMLAAMAAAKGDEYTPVQLQKLFFILDSNAANELGGKLFAFRPYDYGPFDAEVYRVASGLAFGDLVQVNHNERTGFRTYEATAKGMEAGERALKELPPGVRDYLVELSRWVRSLSFSELIAAIYAAYPEMKVNSVFQDAV